MALSRLAAVALAAFLFAIPARWRRTGRRCPPNCRCADWRRRSWRPASVSIITPSAHARRSVRRSSIRVSDITTLMCGWKRPAPSRRPSQYDPDCAMAWWGLSRALEKWGTATRTRRCIKAGELQRQGQPPRTAADPGAACRRRDCVPGVGDADARKKAAVATLDNMLAVYDDDEEAWYYRAQLAGGDRGFGGEVSAVPFYKALLRINPLHPGANHELLHFYENYRRPALGWIQRRELHQVVAGHSAPVPHAGPPGHAPGPLGQDQRPLGPRHRTGTRLPQGDERQAADDQQFSHHLEILLVSLTHDGRFARGAGRSRRKPRRPASASGTPWFRLHLGRTRLGRGAEDRGPLPPHATRPRRATWPLWSICSKATPPGRRRRSSRCGRRTGDKKDDPELEYRLWETQGLLLCQTGSADAGLKLLAKAATRSKNDYGHHAWGNGAYFMEAWGVAALFGDRPRRGRGGVPGGAGPRPRQRAGGAGVAGAVRATGRSDEERGATRNWRTTTGPRPTRGGWTRHSRRCAKGITARRRRRIHPTAIRRR